MQNMGIEVLFKGINSLRLWQGLWVTIRIALISMVFSIILGFLLGMVMNIPNKIIKFICRIYLEIVRIMPQLVLLFLVYFGAAKHLGMNLSGETAAAGDRSRKNFLEIMNRPNRYISREALNSSQINFNELREYYKDKDWMCDRITTLETHLRILG